MAGTANIKNIVLVHGAWGDGGHWRRVVPLLEAQGYSVTAVQLPLESLAGDVAKTTAVLAAQQGPTLLVGHSYGGAVISEAGRDPKVAGLVYLSAYAPEAGESCADLTAKGGEIPDGFFVPDANGFLLLNRAMFGPAFAQDVAADDMKAMNAAQKPTHPNCLQSKVGANPAWKSKPSCYVMTTKDNTVPPPLQRFMADRMKPRKVFEVDGSHASMASRPADVAAAILEAAKS